ncbi:MAG: YhfC family glutamic-type intramembrane protease [Spirochaetia bacterium]|jgi:uncharacterized membrane protein YhfC|nr:YhfC family intramembrane metalloprotease [Verrucomicrobiota bacterium]MDX9784735.1 YhfC family glutamic-type intramembrane protease [Spirochaetia bacterium]
MNDEQTTSRRGLSRRGLIILWLIVAVVIASFFLGRGKVYMNASRTLGPEPVSDLQQLPFEVSGSEAQLKYRIHVKLQTGIVHFRLIRPDGVVIVDSAGKIFSQAGPNEDKHFPVGRYMAEIRAEQALGTWTLAIHDGNYSSRLNSSAIITGKLMVLVGALALLFWRRRTRVAWTYFGIGAALWAVGVALKFGWAFAFNKSILVDINRALPEPAAWVAGALYVGLLTGVFEIGVTILAAKRWPFLSQNSERAIAVGIGAGAFEAIILGLVAALASLTSGTQAAAAGSVSLIFLPAVERILALLCHASSRAMVFFAVAAQRPRWALGGFILMTGLDTVAALFLLSKEPALMNPWHPELAFLPFALISIALLVFLSKAWPKEHRECE